MFLGVGKDFWYWPDGLSACVGVGEVSLLEASTSLTAVTLPPVDYSTTDSAT